VRMGGFLTAGFARNPSLRNSSAKCGEVSGEDSKKSFPGVEHEQGRRVGAWKVAKSVSS
jgi:hypothetical protein